MAILQSEDLLMQYIDIVLEAIEQAQSVLFKGQGKDLIKIKSDGDVTRSVDVLVENLVMERTMSLGLPAQFTSEELGTIDLVNSPQYLIFLDPIDGTDMAVRGYPLASIALSIHEIETMDTVIAVVGDIFQKRIYFASERGSFLRVGADTVRLKPSDVASVREAMMVAYAAKPTRILKLLDQRELITNLKLLLNYGGPLDIAKVGAGSVDAFIEFDKGFKAIDYAAGMYIAAQAGAIATDLQGASIQLPRDLSSRQKFLVSCCRQLHEEILELVQTT